MLIIHEQYFNLHNSKKKYKELAWRPHLHTFLMTLLFHDIKFKLTQLLQVSTKVTLGREIH